MRRGNGPRVERHPAGNSVGANQMAVAGEAEQSGLAGLDVEAALGDEAGDDRVGLSGLPGGKAWGSQQQGDRY